MDKLHKNQQKVFEAASEQLEKYSWYNGTCMNDFPTEEDCKQNFNDCVAQVVMETMYWDAPRAGRCSLGFNHD